MPSLAEIEGLTKKYSEAFDTLSREMRDLNDAIETIRRERMKSIKKAIDQTVEKSLALKMAINDSSELFIRPRTIILHGIKIGFVKGKGKIKIPDEPNTCNLIRKHFPEQAEALIIINEKPSKEALNNLAAADLKKIGVTIIEAVDEVVIKATDGEVEKMVNAFLRESEKEFANAS
jgi:predicted Zn-dependent protease with MMP-like domain